MDFDDQSYLKHVTNWISGRLIEAWKVRALDIFEFDLQEITVDFRSAWAIDGSFLGLELVDFLRNFPTFQRC